MISALVTYARVYDRLQPCVVLTRYDSAVVIPVDHAWMFSGADEAKAIEKALLYADRLFKGSFIKADCMKILDLVTHYMADALRFPPPPKDMVEVDWVKQAQRDHLVVRQEGEIVYDAR